MVLCHELPADPAQNAGTTESRRGEAGADRQALIGKLRFRHVELRPDGEIRGEVYNRSTSPVSSVTLNVKICAPKPLKTKVVDNNIVPVGPEVTDFGVTPCGAPGTRVSIDRVEIANTNANPFTTKSFRIDMGVTGFPNTPQAWTYYVVDVDTLSPGRQF